MSQVVIGMDPHKRTATIEVMAGDEAVVGRGRNLRQSSRNQQPQSRARSPHAE